MSFLILHQLEVRRIERDLTLDELARQLELPKSTVAGMIRTGRANARNLHKVQNWLAKSSEQQPAA